MRPFGINPKYPLNTPAANNPVAIEQISYLATYQLRHEVLWPGQPIDFVKVESDPDGYHYGAFFNGRLASVISLFVHGHEARFRKFATQKDLQNKGIGTLLLRHTLAEAARIGADYIWCDARTDALTIYHRFGMTPDGEVFYKENVAYQKMKLEF